MYAKLQRARAGLSQVLFSQLFCLFGLRLGCSEGISSLARVHIRLVTILEIVMSLPTKSLQPWADVLVLLFYFQPTFSFFFFACGLHFGAGTVFNNNFGIALL